MQQVSDYSNKWYVMAAVAMGIFLATVDASIVNIALPTLEKSLSTQFAVVQWVILAYLLTVTTLLLSIGRLGDIIGKKALYTAGFVIFTAASLLCGLAPTIGWLIAARVLQALGAAMIMALGPALVTEAFPSSERGTALGLAGTAVSVGIVVGPTAGGLLIDLLSWHWIFFVNLPFGIVGVFLVLWFVPAIKPVGQQRFDYPGAITLFVSLLTLLLALTFGQTMGFQQPSILALFFCWIVFLGLFLGIEWRSAQPMINLALFRRSEFSVNLVVSFLTFLLVSGLLVLMPFYLKDVLGFSAFQAGLLLSALPIGLGTMSPISGMLSDKIGPRVITAIGLAVLVCAYSTLLLLDQNTGALVFGFYFLLVGIGIGLFQSPNNSTIMGAAPHEHLGVVSGLMAITRTLGQTIGVAILGAVWAGRAVVYAGNALPDGVTTAPAAVQVAALHDTILLSVVLMSVAFGLSTWVLIQYRFPSSIVEGHKHKT